MPDEEIAVDFRGTVSWLLWSKCKRRIYTAKESVSGRWKETAGICVKSPQNSLKIMCKGRGKTKYV